MSNKTIYEEGSEQYLAHYGTHQLLGFFLSVYYYYHFLSLHSPTRSSLLNKS